MSSLVVSGDTSGSVTLQAPAVSGTTVLTLPATSGTVLTTASGTAATATNIAGGSNGTIPYQSAAGTTQMLAVGSPGQLLQTNGAGAPTWVAAPTGGFTLGTPVATTSGTSIDFTGIPAGTKQIVVLYRGVSVSGTSQFIVQIGDSGGIETTGYSCQAMKFQDTPAITSTGSYTGGWIFNQGQASTANSGSLVLTLENATAFAWCGTGMLHDNNALMTISAGSKALSAELDRVRITTYNGTDTFDAGEINIAYI